MLKHFGGHDLPLASRRISIILEKYTQSCNFPPLSFLTDADVCEGGGGGERMTHFETERGREGQDRETETKTDRESGGEERGGEDGQGKHFACHCVQKAERQN